MLKSVCFFLGTRTKLITIQNCLEAWDWLCVVIQTADGTRMEIPLCLRCSWQSALFCIICFTCSAFRVPSHHSGLGTLIANWCEPQNLCWSFFLLLLLTSMCLAVVILSLAATRMKLLCIFCLEHGQCHHLYEPVCFFCLFKETIDVFRMLFLILSPWNWQIKLSPTVLPLWGGFDCSFALTVDGFSTANWQY